MAVQRDILVWDIPTRLFHWMLVASFAGAFATGESEDWRSIHLLLGYTAGGLIAFRLLWGLVGTRYARFSSFPLSPRSVLGYLKSVRSGSPEHYAGHNPAGSWAIIAILALVAATAVSGWIISAEAGPERLKDLHEALSNAAVVLVVVHVTAVIASSFLHRENLVRAMVTGLKRGAAWEAPAESGRGLIGALLLGAVGMLWGSSALLGPDGRQAGPAGSAAQSREHADD